jgi:hypothetical protein
VHLAAHLGADRCFERLIQTERVLLEAVDQAGVRVVGFAVAGGRIEIVQRLVGFPVEWDCAIHIACLYHRYEILEFLAQKTKTGLLDPLTEKMGSPLHQLATSSNMKGLEFRVESGADINCRDKLTRTPFHSAVLAQDLTVVCRFLSIPGIKINVQDRDRVYLKIKKLHCIMQPSLRISMLFEFFVHKLR